MKRSWRGEGDGILNERVLVWIGKGILGRCWAESWTDKGWNLGLTWAESWTDRGWNLWALVVATPCADGRLDEDRDSEGC